MNTINILKKIAEFGKEYYTLSDLVRLTAIKRKSLKVRLNRMVKSGFISRAARDIYTLPDKKVNAEKTANGLVVPSYLSFDYVLSKKGIISEVPYEIELAVLKKTRRKVIAGVRVIYRKIKKDKFFGFVLSRGVYTAEAEKALLDAVYLRVYGKAEKLPKIDKRRINTGKLKKYLLKYPERVGNYLKKNAIL